MRVSISWHVLIALSLWASPCASASPAERAFQAGAFERAVREGERSQSAEGYTLAAKALLFSCIVEPRSDADVLIDQAIANAENALRLQPESVEARLHLAMALGMRGRRLGVVEALRGRYAQRGRALIDAALARAPEDGWAHALRGGWHFEVVRRGGLAGGKLLGASRKAGEHAFERGLALAQNDPAIPLMYAVALLELDPKGSEVRVAELLARATAHEPKDAFEERVRDEAKRLSAVLATQGVQAAADTAAERFL